MLRCTLLSNEKQCSIKSGHLASDQDERSMLVIAQLFDKVTKCNAKWPQKLSSKIRALCFVGLHLLV